MSQNDFNLANQGFPAMRADMNSAFQALASNSSGATEPGTTYAYQWWYDTDNDILKMRNADDDAWINIASFDQANDTWSPYVGATALTATGAELNLLDGAVDHATAAWEAGTATEAGVPSPADVKAAIDALAGGGADFSAVAEDIIPDADSTRDLGSSSIAWAIAYIDAIEPVGADTTIKRVGGTNATPIVEGIAKSWVNFDGTGTIAARDSLNVSSLTDNGTGDYTVNFTGAFGAGDFAITCTGHEIQNNFNGLSASLSGDYTMNTANVRVVYVVGSNNAHSDTPVYSVNCHGDLA